MGPVLAAVFAVALATMLLTVLTLMREIVLLRGEVAAMSQLITKRPVPRIIGQVLPKPLPGLIGRRSSSRMGAERDDGVISDHIVAFISVSCGPCYELADAISAQIAKGVISADAITCIIVDPTEAANPIGDSLQDHGVLVIEDRDGLADRCDASGTPMLVAVKSDTAEAIHYSYGGDVEWILDQLSARLDRSVAEVVEN